MKNTLRNIYAVLPFKKEIFLILRLFPMPERVFRHLHFEGLITVGVEQRAFKMYHYGYQLENELFWRGINGGWEKVSMKVWIALSKRSTNILDIGANTGVYALVSKAVNPNSRIFAFEPVKRVFEKLKRNAEINNFDITSVCQGISDFEGTATIYDLPTDHVYSVTINQNTNPPDRTVIPTQVEVITLDAYCEQVGLDHIDLLKIDVETHEPSVLRGALRILRKSKPPMIIEILNDVVAAQVNELLNEFDYLYFALNEKSGPIPCDRVGALDFGNYLVCKRSDAEFLKL